MRKRKWVVASLALVVISVGAYLFSQPSQRKGTVDYHKEEYLYRMRIIEKRIGNRYPAFAQRFLLKRHTEQAAFHYRQLMDAGYFEDRVFTLSNRSPQMVRIDQYLTNTDEWLFRVIPVSSNAVKIRAPREARAEIESAVRMFDTPQSQRRSEKLIREADVP
jgi:hypothetical protein